MRKKIAVIRGDGIGPEITAQGVNILKKTAEIYHHDFSFETVLLGGCAIDQTGAPMPEETAVRCKSADSVLLGAVGGPKWDSLPSHLRPEQGLLSLRSVLGLYANIRPSTLFTALSDACPLKSEIRDKGLDFVIVRELTGGIYFGKRGITVNENGEKQAYDTLTYSESEIERIARMAFEFAKKRRKKLTSVDKANVLDSSRLWREVMHKMRDKYPEIEYRDMLVDNCAMQMIRDPSQFDVIVTENMFGDILSDEASMLTGSIGLIPSMSLGKNAKGLYEPIHGSAPDIAGKDIANPIATILSCAMMLKFSFNMEEESLAVLRAVEEVLNAGYATKDISSAGKTEIGCSEMGERICFGIK